MSEQPLVSVIITTFNRADIVGRAIKGVLSQDYPNVEIIVVDDCSTDNTEQYFKENWKSEVKYVRHEKNQGVQFASNTGHSHSNGKYLAFIGDDDQWSDPTKLSEQVRIFEEDEDCRYGIVTTSVKVICPDRTYERILRKPKNLLKHLMMRNGIIYGSAALIRRDVFEKAGRFSEELPRGTDSDVFRRIVLLGYDVFFIETPMVDYYEIADDRMTVLNECGVLRSIVGQNYQFEKYGSYFEVYPKAKSYRLKILGQLYYELYKLRGNETNLKVSIAFFWKSWKLWPLNIRSLAKALLLSVGWSGK